MPAPKHWLWYSAARRERYKKGRSEHSHHDTHGFLPLCSSTLGRSAETHALKDEMATDVKDWDDDCLLESMRPLREDSRLLNDRRAAVLHLEKRIAAFSAKDELDAELKDLGGDCIKVVRLLKADSSLLKDRALAVLHLGVSRGCIEIVEQVVKFYEGEDSLGDRSERGLEKDEQQNTKATEGESNAPSGNKGGDILGERSELGQQRVECSREEEINPSSDSTDAPTVALDGELQIQIDDKNENSDPDSSHYQDDPSRRTASGKGTSSRFRDFVDIIVKNSAEFDEIDERPVLDFDKLLLANYFYSGPARKFHALEVAVVNGNLDVLALLVTKTPSASRIGPKTRSVALRELHRNQLREITERVVESIRGHSVSLKIYQRVFDARRDHPEFNFLFWDFDLGQERVSEYLFHFLCTEEGLGRYSLDLSMYLWREVWLYQGEPWEEPLWKSLLKLHDAQGRTPFHVAVDENSGWALMPLLKELPLADRAEVFAFAMEATDGLGRTPWHRSVLRGDERRSVYFLSRDHKDLADQCREGKVDAPGIYDQKKNEVSYGRLWQHPMESPVSRLKRRGILGLSVPSHYDFEHGFSIGRRVSKTTPLHSTLLQGRINVSSVLYEDIFYGRKTLSPQDSGFPCRLRGLGLSLSPYIIDAFELATLTSNVDEVKRLLISAEQGPLKTAYTSKQNSEWGENNRYRWLVGNRFYYFFSQKVPFPTIHIAAYSGDYEMLKVFIDSKICDIYIEDKDGCTALHAVLDPRKFSVEGDVIDFANVKHIPPNYEGPPPYESTTVGRQGCINLLLQSGCDIFKVDKNGQAPYPKGILSQDKDFLTWWYDRQLKEFNSNQNAMSFATNAISIMATLVATASYVGPLQPPLGYSSGDGPNQIQAKYIWVRIFLVCDTLSFYLAIAAITFSLIPALPMPQQPMATELQKTRGMIILAIATLFPSIICILLAFAAGSIVVISANGISSLGGNLTIITGSIGGVICLIGFLLLFIRLLGIIFPRVRWVRKLYDWTSFFLEGKGMSFPPVAWVNRIRSTLTHYWRHTFKHRASSMSHSD